MSIQDYFDQSCDDDIEINEPLHLQPTATYPIGVTLNPTGVQQALDDYERLQRENERLKAERDLAVRVAINCMHSHITMDFLRDKPDERVYFLDTTYGDIRKVLAWYREAQNAAKPDDGAR